MKCSPNHLNIHLMFHRLDRVYGKRSTVASGKGTVYCIMLRCTTVFCHALESAELNCLHYAVPRLLYHTLLYSATLDCMAPHRAILCTVLYCTAVLYCTVLYCTVLYCTTYTVMYCTVLHGLVIRCAV